MKTAPTFGKFEERMCRRIAAYLRKTETRTPKKREVILSDIYNDPESVVTKSGFRSHRGLTDRRAFSNCIALGLIEHSPNGHCWLTRKGAKKIGVKEGFR